MPGFDPSTSSNIGRALGGRYRLSRLIATGGMAEVWEGHDEVLSRPVAVKVLQAHLASDGLFLERFRREAVTAAGLAHPSVVSTYDTGLDDGTAYIVMELVRGRTLRQLLTERGRLEPWQAVFIASQIADALTYAHNAGLVHRDIKPANVLLVEEEWGGLRVKVTDFGIAKASVGLGGDLTRTGTVLGTPKYLSPEQIRGLDPDGRADLYSLGVVLFEMLVGDPPYKADTDVATALAHLNERIPKVSSRVGGVPAALGHLVSDLLAKDPDRRVSTALVLRQRLDALGLVTAAGPKTRSGRTARGRTPSSGGGPAPPPSPVATPTTRLRSRPAAGTILGGAAAEGTVALPSPPGGRQATTILPRSGLSGVGLATGPPGAGVSTSEFSPISRHRTRVTAKRVGAAVAVLVLIGVVVGVTLLVTEGGGDTNGGAGQGGALSSEQLHIVNVGVYMVDGRRPDNPGATAYTFDDNPNTYWSTDQYRSATFSGLYSGIGLDIQLNTTAVLHQLVVTSPTEGWSAQVYVSAGPIASGQTVSAWGPPVASQTSILGDATFQLGGRRCQYVLLFLTNLGSPVHDHHYQARIAELAVS